MKNKLRIIFTAVLTLSFFVLVIRANPYVKQQSYRTSVAEFNASLGDTETQRENISSGNRGVRTIYLDIDEAALYDEETGLFTHVSERDESWIKDGWITIYD